MTLNAVQTYVAGQLDGLTTLGSIPAAQAWVLPPSVVQAGDNPQIYVWGGNLVEARVTIPRPLAQKRVAHTVTLYVQWISDNDVANVQAFPVLLDAIRGELRAIVLPVSLTDPTTGEPSTLMDIGEKITQQYATPRAMADQRHIVNTATLRVNFAEWLNPA